MIDPSSTGQLTDLQIDIVPPPLRNFGAVPNFSLLKTGDLILSRGLEPDWVERSISGAQRGGGFPDGHGCWTHAAVFLYGPLVAEAVPEKGVRVRSLYDDVLQCVSRVRRPRATDEKGAHIALRAAVQLGTPYSVFCGAAAWQAHEERFMESGCTGFLRKEIDL